MNKIKVLVTDSSPIYAVGLAHSLSKDRRIEVFNNVYSGECALEVAAQVKPDIILMDSDLLNHDWIAFLETLQKQHPGIKIIVLFTPETMESIPERIINTGVNGLLPKNISPEELIKSIIDTTEQGASIHPTMLPQILEKYTEILQQKLALYPVLTDMEKEVLKLVADGKSNREIAEGLFISENTVKGHIKGIMRKTSVNNRVELARYALLNKLI